MEVNFQNLMYIFASRSGRFFADRQSIQDLLFLLENLYLNLEEKYFCDKSVFLGALEKIDSGEIPIFDIDGGKREHTALKYIAKQLWSDSNPKVEVEFKGRVPDIIVRDAGFIYIIECGNTDPLKIFDYFEDKMVREVTIVPFPCAEEDALHMYSFTPRLT